jgi:hypothetical protein
MTACVGQWLVFEIPRPPSANHLYANVPGKGRVKTAAYKDWQMVAGLRALAQLPKPIPHCSGEVFLDIDLPPGVDIDNLKAVADLLQMSQKNRLKYSIGLIADDKLIVDYHVRRVGKDRPFVVRVRPVGEWQ